MTSPLLLRRRIAEARGRLASIGRRQVRLRPELTPTHGRERYGQPLFDELGIDPRAPGEAAALRRRHEPGPHDDAAADPGAHAPGRRQSTASSSRCYQRYHHGAGERPRKLLGDDLVACVMGGT